MKVLYIDESKKPAATEYLPSDVHNSRDVDAVDLLIRN